MKSQIVIVQENGVSKPYFCCGHCGKVIDDASEANIVWSPKDPTQTMIICKAYCCERTQEKHEGGRYWMELDVAYLYLEKNSGVNRGEALEKCKLLASIG